MKLTDRSTFDFDYWRKLAESDPALFEQKRREEIDKMIESVPAGEVQDRLQRLQWRVDMERRRCKTATQSCVRIYSMMWKRVYGDNGLLESLNTLTGSGASNQRVERVEEKSTADILSFNSGSS